MTSTMLRLGAFVLLLGGCASTSEPVATGPTPSQVSARGDAQGEVHWGGQIVSVKNLRDRTLIEILALPLESSGRPRLDGRPQGRFIADRAGFLEPHEYAPNRYVEVQGRLGGFTEGTVGDAPYRYPVVQADRLVLWPDDNARYRGSVSPRINFGVGIGNHGSGVGVGVGF